MRAIPTNSIAYLAGYLWFALLLTGVWGCQAIVDHYEMDTDTNRDSHRDSSSGQISDSNTAGTHDSATNPTTDEATDSTTVTDVPTDTTSNGDTRTSTDSSGTEVDTGSASDTTGDSETMPPDTNTSSWDSDSNGDSATGADTASDGDTQTSTDSSETETDTGSASDTASDSDSTPSDTDTSLWDSDSGSDTGLDTECDTGMHWCAQTGCTSDTNAEACGSNCIACPVPSDGSAVCVAGQCDMDCGSLTLCGDACVDVASDNSHCGGCYHDCGLRSSCDAGLCSVAEVTLSAVDVNGGVAVDENGVYFSDGNAIRMCPLAGCTLTPQQIWNDDTALQLTAGSGYLAWLGQSDSGRSAITSCELASCSPEDMATGNMVDSVDAPLITDNKLIYHRNSYGIPEYVADKIQCLDFAGNSCSLASVYGKAPFDAAGDAVVFYPIYTDAPTDFVYCDLSADSCTPEELMPYYGVIDLEISGDVIYYIFKGMVGPSENTLIRTCTISSGCSDVADYVSIDNSETVVEMEVSPEGEVFWLYDGDAGSVWMCAAGGCPGGPLEIAADQSNPRFLQIEGDNVYWGTLGDGSPGSAGLRRTVKPL